MKEERLRKNFTQKQVAELVGISLRSYISYENDTTKNGNNSICNWICPYDGIRCGIRRLLGEFSPLKKRFVHCYNIYKIL
jgi:transcriptional regulator with XRE-family HTH domain